ncbi:MAG: LD-carboxypeptidase [Coleofasciculaceae cyanobacterium RL_1_1]|nr:LD-carboxypeptidase [Coleofasciculaceae cyanobacterium RL_1_1]
MIVIAPSGCLRETASFEQGVAIWRSRGYDVVCSPGVDDRHGYLAGTDADRRARLRAAWRDPLVKGILCVRGGYGGTRLLEDFEWSEADRAAPKWLIGFSDITSVLWSLARVGVGSVHGAVLTTLADEPDRSRQRLFDLVEGRAIAPLSGRMLVNPANPLGNNDDTGDSAVTGWLCPANLAVGTSLLGTPHQPDFTGAIIAFEDVGEAPYRLDRLLTQWRSMGAFAGVRGIALGRFSQAEVPAGYPSFSVDELMRDRLGDLGIPVLTDLPFGHDGENAALPCGAIATIEPRSATLSITSPGSPT